jgi:hypothetical protein
MGYYSANFENMNTPVIQQWLYVAQHQLDHYKEGVVREMLLEGISNAAAELLFRYREGMKQLYTTP